MGFFEKQLRRGKRGEELFIDTLSRRGNEITDVRLDKEYQAQDVDFIVKNRNNKTATVEVKTDYRMGQTGNLFLEECIEYRSGDNASGWFSYTTADFLAFVEGGSWDIYIYETEALREAVKQGQAKWRYCDDGYKKVYGYCLNKEEVKCQLLKKGENE